MKQQRLQFCCHLTINLFFRKFEAILNLFCEYSHDGIFFAMRIRIFFSQECCENLNDSNISRMFEFVDLDEYILRCAWSTLPANF